MLSHLSAARFWKLLPYPAQPDGFHVTVSGRPRRQRKSIRVHSDDLNRREWMVRDGVPVTNPQRTLTDIAAAVSNAQLAAAVNEAHVQRLVSQQTITHLISEYHGRPGIRALRDLCEDPRMTRSAAERRFLSLLRRAGLALPETNVMAAGHEVDFLWRDERLVVETDGWAAHSSPVAFERDRKRDARLAARGYTILRVSWRRLSGDPDSVAADVAQLLRRSGGAVSSSKSQGG